MKTEEKSKKMNELLKRELNDIFLKELDAPEGILVTITRVETDAKLSSAKVFIGVFPDENEKEVMDNLRRRIYFFQQSLNKRLRIRTVPKMIFVSEDKNKEAQKIETLLEKIKKAD